ncbi:MAG: cob(I)yrinic acid a,c-diamide adenosyltransferase [Oligoflexus sp.]
MRLTKIYTKVGDGGQTLLANGQKIAKDDLRIDAYGTIDELNSHIGLLRDLIQSESQENSAGLDRSLYRIQNELFDLGSELATPADALSPRQILISANDISQLESEIDNWNESLSPLKNFVLPGGHLANSQAHVCRTVCRRAERLLVSLRRQDPSVRKETQIYVNRLSDWLFVCGRTVSRLFDRREVLWDQGRHERK